MTLSDWRKKGSNAERHVDARYEAEGWEVLNRGKPDRLMIKRRGDVISQVAFVEIKNRDRFGFWGGLNPDQQLWAKALIALGLDYRIESSRGGRMIVLAPERYLAAPSNEYYRTLRLISQRGGQRKAKPLDADEELAPTVKRRTVRRVSRHLQGPVADQSSRSSSLPPTT